MKPSLLDIYDALFAHYGPQNWWPGETPFEVAIGAILTQNTSWTNVAKAIANLKAAGCLDPIKLHEMDHEQLELLIRPAGYFRVKAKRLKNFINWLCDRYGGDLKNLESINTSRLRQELLAISGIGPETADSILLYALNRPIFVVDTYTARVMARHGLIGPDLDYQQLQDLFMSNLEPDPVFFNEFHALIVRLCQQHCKKKPDCTRCPLAGF